ncbi:MAG: hypothetical protein LUF35_09315 [Lachnospiraceae bacterium]|nr:hypothetical protein [Lachnospiraceae bacterium]
MNDETAIIAGEEVDKLFDSLQEGWQYIPAIEAARHFGAEEPEIVAYLVEEFHITKEKAESYVKNNQ